MVILLFSIIQIKEEKNIKKREKKWSLNIFTFFFCVEKSTCLVADIENKNK